MTARPYKIPFNVLLELVYYQDLFDLSYSQLRRYLEKRHGVRYSSQGLRLVIIAFRDEQKINDLTS